MYRSAYILLFASLIVAIFASPLLAEKDADNTLSLFYDPVTDNTVTGPPPNYQQIDPTYFFGAPRFELIDQWDVGGYNVYFDTSSNLWTVSAIVHTGGIVYEQLHGSILIQLDPGQTPDMAVTPLGFAHSSDLRKNDRWGYAKYPDTIAENLYEIWWDITIDYARLENESDVYDTVGIAFSGCAFDFNLWATGHLAPFDADQLFIGKRRIPISYIPNYSDTYTGLTDESQTTTASAANVSTFAISDLPGATFDANGLIPADEEFGGSYVYEGNGVEFSVTTCPPNSNNPPYFYWPSGTTKIVNFCAIEPIYDTVKVLDPDIGDILTLTKNSGPGEFPAASGASPVRGYFSWTPTEAGTYTVVYQVTDTQGHTVVDTMVYVITIDNNPPVAYDTDTTIAVCANQISACVFVNAFDPDGNALTYRLVGDKTYVTLDENSGELCLNTSVSGTYSYQVEVSDNCSLDTAVITFHIMGNNNPYINEFDSTIYLCDPETICFEVTASDLDAGDSLEVTQIAGPGVFTQTGDGVGTTCFLPADIDSAQYVFTYQVTDNCWRGDPAAKCPQGTIIITVIMGTKPQITCPQEPLVFDLCAPDTVCAPITVFPPGVDITVVEPGANYVDGALCVFAEETGTFTYTLIASGECGADTCAVTFDITMGAIPVIDCPTEDIIVNLCNPDSICIDVAISPIDAQISILEPGAVYRDGQICFYAGESGIYSYTLTASGECGDDTCRVTVDVTLGAPPVIACPEELLSYTMCAADSICIDLPVTPGDVPVGVIGQGAVYENGRLCFYADESKTYTFDVVAFGECGNDTCRVEVDVNIDTPPMIECPDSPIPVSFCNPDTVCVPIMIFGADSVVDIVEDGPAYQGTNFCFFADTSGTYTYTIIATNECGADTCVVTFEVIIDGPPQLTCIEDQTVHLCGPGEIAIPLGVVPPSTEVIIIPQADYADGIMTFFADTAGTYCFRASASNECGDASCDFCITITMDTPPVVAIDGGSYFQCEPMEVCLPVTATDVDGNLVSVTVDPAEYEIIEGNICFTPSNPGTYRFIVTATDDCGNAGVDTADVIIESNQAPWVTIGDSAMFVCGPTEICLPVEYGDVDNEIVNIQAISPAYFDSETDMVCVPVTEPGDITVIVTVIDECGVESSATGTLHTDFNSGPIVSAPDDTTVFACTPGEICLSGFEFSDIDNNIIEISFSPDLGIYENEQYCFTPSAEGVYCIAVQATDVCGFVAVDTVCVTYTIGEEVTITCPEPQTYDLCAAQTVCAPVIVDPPDAEVTVVEGGAVYENGELCFYAETTGQYTFILIASGECGSDTCQAVFDITTGTLPVITCPTPDPVHFCLADSIFIPIAIDPADAHITVSPEAVFSDGNLGFFASVPGEYCYEIIASGECGADTCQVCITVTFDAPPVVTVPDSSLYLCQPEEICIPIAYSDPDNNIVSVEVIPETYQIIDGCVCFIPSGAGDYRIIVIVTDECGFVAVDTSDVSIALNQPPTLEVADTAVFICAATDICVPIAYGDPDGTIDSIIATAPAYIDYENSLVCLPLTQAGEFTVTVTVYDDCGSAATDAGIIIATTNNAPVVGLGDYPQFHCELEQICVPVIISDVDDNVVSVTVSGDCGETVYDESESAVCWMPTAFGSCRLTVIVTDICGAADTVSEDITISESPQPNAQCPGDTTIDLCEAGQLCLDFGDLVLGSNFTILPPSIVFYPETNAICYNVSGNRVDTVTVIDSTDCGVDTCSFAITARVNRPPVIAVVEPDEVVFCDSATVCFEVTVTDPDDNLADVYIQGNCPEAVYNAINGTVCVYVTQETHCSVEIIAVDACNKAYQVIVPINAVPNRPPVINPPHIETIIRCVTDTDPIVVEGICVTDPEYDEVMLVLDSGLGELSFSSLTDCGTLTFTPPTNDTAVYCFRFMAFDYCDTTFETFCLNYYPTPVCGACVDVSIQGPPNCVNNGILTTANIVVEAFDDMAAFDLLIAYDASALYFTQADQGGAIAQWEYFTYRFGDGGNCDACPSGILRIVGIADVNNGPYHPSEDQYFPDGIIASLTYRVTTDVNFGGQNIPISFLWIDCGDNSLSDRSGQYLYIDKSVISREGNLIWDEADEIHYPESGRIPNVGAPDECLQGIKDPPVRCVDFRNGEICIIHPDSIDARGDLNLNGIANEIADAVVYTNFFIVGLSAFRISIPGQIAASDVNADGVPLTVADLVQLVRIITGDAQPLPKPSISNAAVDVRCRQSGSKATLGISSAGSIGAALFVFDYEGPAGGEILPLEAVGKMNILHAWEENQLRLLIYSFEPNRMIEAGVDELIDLIVPEGGRLELVEVQMADYYANSLKTAIHNTAIPSRLSLSQNYPNPFNPTTTFVLSIPEPSDYRVVIYNIMGQALKTWVGCGEAGEHVFEWDGHDDNGNQVASGIYFYKASAAGSDAIRKMVLLK